MVLSSNGRLWLTPTRWGKQGPRPPQLQHSHLFPRAPGRFLCGSGSTMEMPVIPVPMEFSFPFSSSVLKTSVL